jgi:hypothetical protein
MIKFKWSNRYKTIWAENPSDNIVDITVEGNEYASIEFNMDDPVERQALKDLGDYIKYNIHRYNQERLEKLRFEKPGPNAVTVGDLIGLKREE